MSCGKNGSGIARGLSLGNDKTGKEASDKMPASTTAKNLRGVTCKLPSLHLDLCRRQHNQSNEHQTINSHVQTKIDEAVHRNPTKTNYRSETDSPRKVICRLKVLSHPTSNCHQEP